MTIIQNIQNKTNILNIDSLDRAKKRNKKQKNKITVNSWLSLRHVSDIHKIYIDYSCGIINVW